MDRTTAIQQAGIAAEAVNGTNQRLRAALEHWDDVDLKRLKDAYEVACSLKLMAQRLTLTTTQLATIVGEWHEEGHLHTAPAIDADATVADYRAAMARAHTASIALFTAFDDATKSLVPIGWKDPDATTSA